MKQKKNTPPPQTAASNLTISNSLSALRALLTIPLVVLLLDGPTSNRLAILGIAVLAYGSDLLDGWLARTLKQESDLGRMLDPLADKIFVGAGAIALLVTGVLPLWFGVLVLARDVVIFAGGMWLRRRTGVLVQSTMLGKFAVVAIAVVLVASLFRADMNSTTFTLLQLVALGFIAASLTTYGQRFFRILQKK